MLDENYIIRKMASSEVNMAIELATQEGWNPGLHVQGSHNEQWIV